MEKRKNIHLLATDKGQRITKTSKGTLLWCSKSAEDFIETRKGYLGFHLYITNDEEIKEGDWCYDVALKVFQASHNFNGYNNNLCKKIILTTDQDLIKDNVQAIDNEFLEWFVKNSSCESVEIGEGVRYEDEWIDNEDGGEIFQHQYCCYKIIIPIEEPKRTHYLDELPNIDKDTLAKMWEATIPRVEPKREVFLMNAHGVLDTREPKQETLEKAAEKYAKTAEGIDIPYQNGLYYGFVEGAKWQAERMYSEEEVRLILDKTLIEYSDIVLADIPEWFEQFKKK
jgi:hypothetical protein